MQIVIDIPKTIYTNIKSSFSIKLSDANTDKVIKAIKNGTPLPKGHGDLVDKKEVYKKFYCRCLAGVAEEVLKEASVIIEADKEVEHDD